MQQALCNKLYATSFMQQTLFKSWNAGARKRTRDESKSECNSDQQQQQPQQQKKRVKTEDAAPDAAHDTDEIESIEIWNCCSSTMVPSNSNSNNNINKMMIPKCKRHVFRKFKPGGVESERQLLMRPESEQYQMLLACLKQGDAFQIQRRDAMMKRWCDAVLGFASLLTVPSDRVSDMDPQMEMSPRVFDELWALRPASRATFMQRRTLDDGSAEVTLTAGRRWQQAYLHNYHFSGRDHAAIERIPHPYLVQWLKWVHIFSGGLPYYQLLVNWYENGHDIIGMHSDDTTQLFPVSDIYTSSYGATRMFKTRAAFDGPINECADVPMVSGTIGVMEGSTQDAVQHGVLEEAHVKSRRLNITARLFACCMASRARHNMIVKDELVPWPVNMLSVLAEYTNESSQCCLNLDKYTFALQSK